MTAVETPRPARPGGPVSPPGGSATGGPTTGGWWTHTRVATLVVLACMAVGLIGTYLVVVSSAGRYQSTATIVFTAGAAEADNIGAGSRFVQARTDSWAQIASSDAVRNRAAELGRAPGGTAFDPATVQLTAGARSGTEIVELTATSDDEAAVPAEATYAAQALIEVVTASERYPSGELRVTGDLASPGTAAVDHGAAEAQWWGVLGCVAGFVVGLGICSLLRPGGWARDLAPQPVRNRRRAVDLNAAVMGDELRDLVRALRTGEGKLTVIAVAVAVAGYGTTGLFVFPLLVVVAAAVWTVRTRDARWSTAALLFVGIGVFPEKVDLVKLGPVTPTVLEVALLVAVVLALLFRRSLPRSVFAWPVLAIVGAVLLGSVVALLKAGDFSAMIDNTRAILMVVGFFPVWLAFARRPHQLIAVLLAIAGVCSSVVIVAAFAGWERLLVDERSSVITGSETSAVARLSGPVLDMWAPLLILLLSALVPRRPRWLWLALVFVGVLHQALSFNRSTWAPLIVLIVVVAAVTHGPQGLVRRLLGLVAVGTVGLTLALSGLLGSQGEAIAQRATSVVTGSAYGEDSLPDRLRENGAALITLRDSPWVGTGVGQPYNGELLTYDSEHSRTVVEQRPYIHNQYLRMWLFMGIAGLLAYAFVGVRTFAVTFHSWRLRAAGAPMVVGVSLGLVCLAGQAVLQTTLVARPTILTTVALMAAAAAFATWAPWPGAPRGGAAGPATAGSRPSSAPTAAAPRPPGPAGPTGPTGPTGPPGRAVPAPTAPRRPADRAGTLEG